MAYKELIISSTKSSSGFNWVNHYSLIFTRHRCHKNMCRLTLFLKITNKVYKKKSWGFYKFNKSLFFNIHKISSNLIFEKFCSLAKVNTDLQYITWISRSKINVNIRGCQNWRYWTLAFSKRPQLYKFDVAPVSISNSQNWGHSTQSSIWNPTINISIYASLSTSKLTDKEIFPRTSRFRSKFWTKQNLAEYR